MEKLRPCPFCGGEEICIHIIDGGFNIHCDDCGINKEAPTILGGESGKDYLVEWWNKRV